MPKKIDLSKLKNKSISDINQSVARFDKANSNKHDYLFSRWVASMTAVEQHAIWERYVESRLVTGLNHNATHFVANEQIRGVTHISSGLATYIVRGGRRFFDFRSMSELLQKGDTLLGAAANPFRQLHSDDRAYIDLLAAVRNCIVHGSDSSRVSYRAHLKKVYGIIYPPDPDEFLNAVDNRTSSPLRYQPRIKGIAIVLTRAIQLA